ncbi:MAG: Crp/Fnr family transcriptional regulator, partial [Bacteroidota bacterium]
LETCQVKVIPYDDFLRLEDRFPKLSRLTLEFMMYLLDLFSQKLNLLQFQSASDKYELYLDMHPNLTNRVSLGSIASFLGITQQTLSVVRAKKNK